MRKSKTAVIVGLGIGQVYLKELVSRNYHVITIDSDYSKSPDYESINAFKDDFKGSVDVAVICTPNFLHFDHASEMAQYSKTVFVEKPGFRSEKELNDIRQMFPGVSFFVVDNNRYRSEIDSLRDMIWLTESVEIVWTNRARVPNPGSWFTDSSKAFGGVSYDLMPHILTFIDALFEPESLAEHVALKSGRTLSLDQITETDYGTINQNGVYDVDDCSFLTGNIYGVSIIGKAAWQYGDRDQREIILKLKSGPVIRYDFGLCPEYAYGNMIDFNDSNNSTCFTNDLHRILDSQQIVSSEEILKEFQKCKE